MAGILAHMGRDERERERERGEVMTGHALTGRVAGDGVGMDYGAGRFLYVLQKSTLIDAPIVRKSKTVLKKICWRKSRYLMFTHKVF
jgi:hypothetical protein